MLSNYREDGNLSFFFFRNFIIKCRNFEGQYELTKYRGQGYNPVFDSFLRQKVSQTALLATCETFFYFYDCTLHYLFFCLGNNFFHFRYRYDLL